jgi:hypothetical protein
MAKRSDVNRRSAGRPRSARPAGQRSTLSLRITAELFEQLDQAAKAKGRTLSAEAEMRLEFAGRDERRLDEALELIFGRQLAGLLMLLGNVMRDAGQMGHVVANRTVTVAPDWMADAFAYRQVVRAVTKILMAFCPEGEPVPAHLREPMIMGGVDLNEVHRNLGRVIATTYLTAIADPELAPTPDLQHIGREVREKLGPAVVGRKTR